VKSCLTFVLKNNNNNISVGVVVNDAVQNYNQIQSGMNDGKKEKDFELKKIIIIIKRQIEEKKIGRKIAKA